MKVVLTQDNYYSGSYAKIGDIEGAIEIPSIPQEEDSTRQLASKWNGKEWLFDNEKYQELLQEQEQQKKTEESKPTLESLQEQLDNTMLGLAEVFEMLEGGVN